MNERMNELAIWLLTRHFKYIIIIKIIIEIYLIFIHRNVSPSILGSIFCLRLSSLNFI